MNDEPTGRTDDEDFWAKVNAAYARLRADPTESAAFDAEIAVWDVTPPDGLDDGPWQE